MGKDFCSFQQVVEPCGFISFLQNKQKVLIIKKAETCEYLFANFHYQFGNRHMNYYLHVCDARTNNLTKIISLVIAKNKLTSVVSVCLIIDTRKTDVNFLN